MQKRDAALRRYYRDIHSYLPCPRRMKKQILDEVKSNVSGYLEANPEAGLPEIESQFGSARAIAAAYVEDMNTPELLAALRLRKKIMAVVFAFLLAALVLWTAVLGVTYVQFASGSNGYVEIIVDQD